MLTTIAQAVANHSTLSAFAAWVAVVTFCLVFNYCAGEVSQ